MGDHACSVAVHLATTFRDAKCIIRLVRQEKYLSYKCKAKGKTNKGPVNSDGSINSEESRLHKGKDNRKLGI